MSSWYYLPLRYDALAKYDLRAVIIKNHPDIKHRQLKEYKYVIKHNNMGYWWNVSIKTAMKIPHNEPDIVIWDKLYKKCSILQFSFPADVKISNKVN